jgi:hypothetical protein
MPVRRGVTRTSGILVSQPFLEFCRSVFRVQSEGRRVEAGFEEEKLWFCRESEITVVFPNRLFSGRYT